MIDNKRLDKEVPVYICNYCVVFFSKDTLQVTHIGQLVCQ